MSIKRVQVDLRLERITNKSIKDILLMNFLEEKFPVYVEELQVLTHVASIFYWSPTMIDLGNTLAHC